MTPYIHTYVLLWFWLVTVGYISVVILFAKERYEERREFKCLERLLGFVGWFIRYPVPRQLGCDETCTYTYEAFNLGVQALDLGTAC